MTSPKFQKKLTCPNCDDNKPDAVGLLDEGSDALIGWCICGAVWCTQHGETLFLCDGRGGISLNTDVYKSIKLIPWPRDTASIRKDAGRIL